MSPVILRNVEVEGRPGLDVRLEQGRVAQIGLKLSGAGETIDGRGGALLPGFIDHHIHLLATAAQSQSVRLDELEGAAAFERRISAALAGRPHGAWLRVTGYHERIAGDLDRERLDLLAPCHPVRIQHQTGALWVLNSAALAALGEHDLPPVVERDDSGRPTGRIWRGDAWLRSRLPEVAPDLSSLGRTLAGFGVTGLTDASATTDASAAALLAQARLSGALPQRLMLMSAGPLPPSEAVQVGPVKVLLDDARLIELDDLVARIQGARPQGRSVAVHCVTAGELALTLAAFELAGAVAGDRIEHGGVIPAGAIPQIRALGLLVVTQPAFVFERGDRYLADVPPEELPDLYRCASLIAAGVPVAASSDAPYASPDPWTGVAAASARRTRAGQPIGVHERLAPTEALQLYLSAQAAPGGPSRRVVVGAAADLCLLDSPLAEALLDPSSERVRGTFIGGEAVFLRS